MIESLKDRLAPTLALFTTSGTLICCALPILLVSLGLGSTVAAITSVFPLLITLSLHKTWVFAGSAIVLAISVWLSGRSGRSCPTDPRLAARCQHTKRWNKRILIASTLIWAGGFFFAYLALPLRIWLDGSA